ncbi:hypothetical protein L1887_19617 [Cichorium endivia]|nr:hypothetical protein L1887_19617 [Cichorium endivia]
MKRGKGGETGGVCFGNDGEAELVVAFPFVTVVVETTVRRNWTVEGYYVNGILSTDNDAGGYEIAEIFYQAFNGRFGSGTDGIICLLIVSVAIFFCAMSCITSNFRF